MINCSKEITISTKQSDNPKVAQDCCSKVTSNSKSKPSDNSNIAKDCCSKMSSKSKLKYNENGNGQQEPSVASVTQSTLK